MIINKKNNHKKENNQPYIFKIKSEKDIQFLTKETKITSKFSPLSGAETKYEPQKWNHPDVISSHNCYSYAMGHVIKKLTDKAQPGFSSGFNYINDTNMTCKNFKKRILKDNPGSYIEKFENRCLEGFYKVFLALDVGNDYHWWKEDDNKYWSHKPGATEISNVDGNEQLIKNPLLSSRNFGIRNYDKPCFYACVHSDLTRTLDDIFDK
jgi:hypothetical protein